MTDLVSVYQSLPYPARVLVASVKGYSLRFSRYGANTDRYIAEALERDQWSIDRWTSWQEGRLAFVLHRAATKVPYYREYWSERRRKGDRSSWERLENWPILKKEPIRLNAQAFVANDCDIRKMDHEFTSGTTGKSLSLWRNWETTRNWYAIFDARTRVWNGVTRNDHWAILGGRLIVRYSQTRPPFWVWNAGMNQLYLSCYHLKNEYGAAYLDAIQKHDVVYLLGYPSALYSLASIIRDESLKPPTLRFILTNAEQLYSNQRKLIEDMFQCPVIDTYGMEELVAAGSECAHKSMHLWPELGMIEVLQEEQDAPAAPGEVGRLICTGLLNADMPFIRYQVGDLGSIEKPEVHCACGRGLPILKSIDGRADDIILTPDGRRVGRLSQVFLSQLPIHEAQIIQESRDCLRLRLVPLSGYSSEAETVIAGKLRERLGEMQITFEQVDSIPRSANGKFREIINRIEHPDH